MYMKKINLSASHLNGIFADREVGNLISEFVDRYPGKWFSAQQLYQKHVGEPVSFSDTAERINLVYKVLSAIPSKALEEGWFDSVIAFLREEAKYGYSENAETLLSWIEPKPENSTCPRCGGVGTRGGIGNCGECGGKGWVKYDDE